MKSQNTNNKLTFNKSSLTELNDNQLNNIEGGTSPLSIAVGVTVGIYIYYEYFDE